jgi:hypothetical protein
MKPENELLAEEVAFVNTCRAAFESLKALERGVSSLRMAISTRTGGKVVFDTNKKREALNAQDDEPNGPTLGLTDPKPLTLQEFDAIVRDKEAELPPTKERADLREAAPEVPVEMTTPARPFQRPVKPKGK